MKEVDTELKEEVRGREEKAKKALAEKEKEEEENGEVTPVQKQEKSKKKNKEFVAEEVKDTEGKKAFAQQSAPAADDEDDEAPDVTDLKRLAQQKKKEKQDRIVAAQLQKEDEKREEAIEKNFVPPELMPSAGGPVIEGVPVENVSLAGVDEDNFSTNDEEPDTVESLQLSDNLEDPSLD